MDTTLQYRGSEIGKTLADSLSSATDTSDDSDSSDDVQWKRQKKTKKLSNPLKNSLDHASASVGSKPKRNCIWANVLAGQILSDNVNCCGIDTVTEKTRDVESYNYKKKSDLEHDSKHEEETNELQSEIGPPFKKLGKAKQDKFAAWIAKKLHEPKSHLIENVVREVGKNKTMELYKRTMKIEDNGGELTANGLRRRSPGGVFFMLLKSDPEIKRTQIDNIFKDEKEIVKRRKKVIQSYKRRQKYLQLTKNLETTEMDVETTSASSTTDTNGCEKINNEHVEKSIPENEHERSIESGEIVDDLEAETVAEDIKTSTLASETGSELIESSRNGISSEQMEDDELEPGEIL